MKPNHKCDPARMALLYIRQHFICTTFKFDAYDNEPIIYISIVDIGLNKVISIKTNLVHDFSTIERENHRFIKKYNLKVDKEEKKITFLHP